MSDAGLEDYFVPYLICVKIVWTLSLVLSPSRPFRQRYNVGGELPLVKETSDIMVSESESGLIRMMKTRQTSPTKHAISHVMGRAGRAPPPPTKWHTTLYVGGGKIDRTEDCAGGWLKAEFRIFNGNCRTLNSLITAIQYPSSLRPHQANFLDFFIGLQEI